MADESKRIDPDATVTQPLTALDPEATVTQPLAALDPEATVTQPLARPEPDPEATDRRPAFDPDATVNPAERASLDPEATVRIPSPGKVRNNPFAPKSSPESLQANLSSLGGINPLVAMANPILSAVPQIRRTLRHPDPALLRANLRDQIESLQTSAMSADVPDATVETAVYALCALLDESAAATPWGVSWAENGLLKEVRGESGGGEGFFKRLDQLVADYSPEDEGRADLLEFFYICIALGFEGRYRNAEGGKQALEQIRTSLYATISRRRPRPVDGLSARWRSATAEAAAAPALQMAAQISAKISAGVAPQAGAAASGPAPAPSLLARLPRRAVWSALAAFVGAVIVFYLLALRLLEDETKSAFATRPAGKAKTAELAAPPAAARASAALAKALEGEPVAITDNDAGVTIALRSERQFPVGGTQLAAELRPLIRKIAAALDQAPGAILVAGHADATPPHGAHFASNADLSAARARSVAQLMAPKLGDAKRLATEGRGDAEPVAPNDTEANRARNRRVTIVLKAAP
ncbi:MAG TPA: type IVB secretion system protein IcmH/DotU [Burkholderiales bacterium]|nr:type IVB secretion system protein IcmH/DotU [Burkholderiales bacterium]